MSPHQIKELIANSDKTNKEQEVQILYRIFAFSDRNQDKPEVVNDLKNVWQNKFEKTIEGF